MYEFMVLGSLARGPKHGYLIARIINDVAGPFRMVSWGALYPVLKKMEACGWISVEETQDSEGRTRTVYAITDAGRVALHDLLMNTEKHLAQYDRVFALKVSLFPFLTADERLYLCRHYAVHAQQNIDHQERERRDLEERVAEVELSPYLQSIFTVMDHTVERWRGELRWAQELIEQCHQDQSHQQEAS